MVRQVQCKSEPGQAGKVKHGTLIGLYCPIIFSNCCAFYMHTEYMCIINYIDKHRAWQRQISSSDATLCNFYSNNVLLLGGFA